MARTSGRVVLSKNPKENLELAEKIMARHSALGATSPLNGMDGVDVNTVLGTVAATTALHNTAENFKRQMEESYRQRDTQMEPIVDVMKKSINLLKATFAQNPKKLGEWGINIDDSKTIKTPTA